MANRVLATGLIFPEGPAVDAQGRMWCGEMGDGNKFITCVEPGGTPRRAFAPGGTPSGNAFDGNDRIWTTGGPEPSLMCTTQDGEILMKIVGDEEGPFLLPNDMAFGPDGLLYLTDSGITAHDLVVDGAMRPDFASTPYDGRVFQIDPRTGKVLKRLKTGMNFTNGIAFGPDGALYVDESMSARVFRFDLYGPSFKIEDYARVMDTQSKTNFEGPDGMAFSEDGTLYCALFGASAIARVAPGGGKVDRLPTNGHGPSNLAFVADGSGIAITEAEHSSLEFIPTESRGLALHKPIFDLA